MASLYTFYNGGNFEAGSGYKLHVYEKQNSTPGAWTYVDIGNFDYSTDFAQAGTKSFKFTSPSTMIGGALRQCLKTNAFIAGSGLGSSEPANKYVFDASKTYRLSAWVRVPSGNPIASPGAVISFFDFNILIGLFGTDVLYEDLPDGRIRAYRDLDNSTMPENWPFLEFTIVKVEDCVDEWKQIEMIFKGNAVISAALMVQLYKFNWRSDTGDGAWVLDLTEGGTVTNQTFTDGSMYIDGIDMFEVVECDLTRGTPPYTKSDETAVDADNGIISAIYTSSYTKEYSLDGVTWQTNATFTGLAPGSYTLYVRDTAGCTDSIPDIIIVEYTPAPDPPDPPAGPITVDAKPLNRRNFIYWFGAVGPVNTFTSIECTNQYWDIPKGYNVQDKTCRVWTPIAVPLEGFNFYANFDTPNVDPNIDSYRLGLINESGLVANEIGILQKVAIEPNAYHLFAVDVTIPAGLPFGFYKMVIYNTGNGAIVMLSNPIQLMGTEEAKQFSVQTIYSNKYNFYNYYYELVPDFLQKIRLRLYRVDEQPDGDLTQYRAVSTGRMRNVSFELDAFIKLEAYYFDDLGHRGMMVWQAHGLITINGFYYLPKSLYKWEFDSMRDCVKGSIELYDQDFSTANRYAPLSPITIIGSDGPFLLGDNGGRIKL